MKSRFQPVQLGPNVQLPTSTFHKVNSFAGGLDLRDAPEDLAPGSAIQMNDMQVTRDDRLQRVAGVSQVDNMPHVPTQMILHPGYKYSSSLLLFAPPYIGIRTNAGTTWYDAGLPAGVYGWTDYAGVLLFSCGVKGLYSKQPDDPAITLIPKAPAALGVTGFATRVVLGATIVSGNMDLMGIGWSDASADYQGWDLGSGAGAQSMIGSMRRADKFQGFAQLGFQTLAIVNRRSLWTAVPTGDVFQPMNIAPRLEDTGATHAATVLPTEYGALFLSDDGVRVFDGNSSLVISEPINPQLLPVLEGDPYTASVDPRRRVYRLHTPTVTWVYDIAKKLWYRQPRTYLASVWFPVQGAPSPTWGAAVGTWADQTKAWWQLDPQEFDGSMYFVRGALLGVEDPSVETDFGVQMLPRWFDKTDVGDDPDLVFTSLAAYLTVDPLVADASVSIWMPDRTGGDYSQVTTVAISASPETQRIKVPFIWSSRSVGIGIQIESGSPLIRKASIKFQPTSNI